MGVVSRGGGGEESEDVLATGLAAMGRRKVADVVSDAVAGGDGPDGAGTKWCHLCGSEFVAGIERCPDCGVALRDEPPKGAYLRIDGVDDEDVDDVAGEVEYDLAEWAGEARRMLESVLNARNVPHVWQGTTLIARARDEAPVDNIIDEVSSMDARMLDLAEEQTVYDLSDWSSEMQHRFVDLLEAQAIEFELDGAGELVVYSADEIRVDEMLDAFEHPDQLPVDNGAEAARDAATDAEAQALLSDLFIAADRLMHDSRDPQGVVGVVDTATVIVEYVAPYGIDEDAWAEICQRATDVRILIENDDPDDLNLMERARELREQIRPIV